MRVEDLGFRVQSFKLPIEILAVARKKGGKGPGMTYKASTHKKTLDTKAKSLIPRPETRNLKSCCHARSRYREGLSARFSPPSSTPVRSWFVVRGLRFEVSGFGWGFQR